MTYEELLYDIAMADERLVVMTAENRAAIRGLPSKLGGRFIDVGICEQTMVGAATGLALRGRIPVVHALATFLTLRAFEFIRTDVGISGLPVKLVGGVPGFLSDANGPTHQAIEDISLMRGIPPVNVFCPADVEELVEGMRHIIPHPSPWYVRYNAAPPATAHPTPFAIGRAETFGSGGDAALLTYGFLVRETIAAQRILDESGLRTRVLNMRTLKPVDEQAILDAARSTGLLVVIEDHFETGGLTSIVAETLMRAGRSARVLPIALPHRWFTPGLLDAVLDHEGFTGAKLADRIRRALQRA